MARFFLTGAKGLIGSHLTRRLICAGHSVHGVDSETFFYGSPPPNLRGLLAYRSGQLLRGAHIRSISTLDSTRLRDEIARVRPDVIVHLAALPLVRLAAADPAAARASIVEGARNVAEAAARLSPAVRVVHVSSSMVYGDFERDPIREDDPTRPCSLYGVLKLEAEDVVRSLLEAAGASWTIARPCAVYGPGDTHRRVVDAFCAAGLARGSVEFRPSRDLRIDFTHVDDVSAGIELAAISPAAVRQVFNVSFGQARTLKDLAAAVSAATGHPLGGRDADADRDCPRRGALCIAKARRLLGYAPEWPLERGIAAMLDVQRRLAPLPLELHRV